MSQLSHLYSYDTFIYVIILIIELNYIHILNDVYTFLYYYTNILIIIIYIYSL